MSALLKKVARGLLDFICIEVRKQDIDELRLFVSEI